MVTECMLPALWATLAIHGDGRAIGQIAQPMPRDHGQALDHTASRADVNAKRVDRRIDRREEAR
jgi:chorismate--pyruvate lyase